MEAHHSHCVSPGFFRFSGSHSFRSRLTVPTVHDAILYPACRRQTQAVFAVRLMRTAVPLHDANMHVLEEVTLPGSQEYVHL